MRLTTPSGNDESTSDAESADDAKTNAASNSKSAKEIISTLLMWWGRHLEHTHNQNPSDDDDVHLKSLI